MWAGSTRRDAGSAGGEAIVVVVVEEVEVGSVSSSDIRVLIPAAVEDRVGGGADAGVDEGGGDGEGDAPCWS